MGTSSRGKPERLGEKLQQIRLGFGLSQTEMLKRLEVEDRIAYNEISKYERGTREPTLIVLLQYARAAGIHVEALIDDDLNLPKKLPGPVKYGAIRRAYVSRSRSKKREG
jgi:transcriptional regulator with XRE-family HTH domain